MQVDYDKKSGEVTVKFTVNPKSTQLSSTGKTFIAGQDGCKLDIDGHSVRISVIATIANDKAKKGKK